MKIYGVLPLIVLPALIAIAGSSGLSQASAQSSQPSAQGMPQCGQPQQGGSQQPPQRPQGNGSSSQGGQQQQGGSKPTKLRQQTNWGSSQGKSQQKKGQQAPPQGNNRQGPDFAAAAQKLGISEVDLKAALGVPPTP
jgi:hypothetical protein